ncbi:imelysin family protein [Paracoccus marinaquae]|uniref:Imelysin family protein n=1 Tax=Paracoccus marinaquae TaxID=2841926 RepID=A0ABS6AEH6_9RHOB|nr:imelysin family protein [Paracoccus marinaquae]MBU3028923.1 imelysin family protein [Paracoccus marinaquae]
MRLALLLAFLPLPALAGVAEAVDDQILPATERFAASAGALAGAAAADCTAPALRPAYQDTFDAWMGMSHLTFGPLERDGRALTIEFWPDPRGRVARTVRGLASEADPVVGDAAGFAQVSIAGRGLMALEQLLYDEELSGYGAGDYPCRYATAIARDLAAMAEAVQAEWQDHSRLMLSAGEPGNPRYLAESEASQALYTALLGGLEFDADQRLGRPLGSFDKPRPRLAEARRSDRPLRNISLSLAALRDLAVALSDAPIPATQAAFEAAQATAGALDDPRLAGVADPAGRLKVEILQQQIRAISDAIEAEIGGALGLTAGFNSQDGD